MRPRLSLLAALGALAACAGEGPPPGPARPLGEQISATGVVEPIGDERVLIPEVGGRLARVLIERGQTVRKGELLAELDNADQHAALAAAEAELALREAELERLKNGARPGERDEAAALAAEAEAIARQAAGEFERRERLHARGQLGREALELARAQRDATAARALAAAARLRLLVEGARAEDLAIAAAAVAAARAARERAAALLEKTRIRSPIDGVVLARDLGEGETVVALSPIPLARIGDLSARRVRIEIDELDLARVAVGQRATVTSDAYPGRQWTGELVAIAERMGRRRVRSDDPSERVDTRVLEAEVALEPGAALPIGLRVDVRLDAGRR